MEKFKIGTTSFIFPAPIFENCKKLEHLVDEVSIVMFETKSCLNYTVKDLPYELKDFNLTYNIHLPLDLDWQKGISFVLEDISRLIDKTLFLNPTSYVLHPPQSKQTFIEFVEQAPKRELPINKFLIENIKENNLVTIWDIVQNTPLNVCLDIGHLLEYNQFDILNLDKIFQKIKMLHLYTPKNGIHKSLALLDKKGISLLQEILTQISSRTSQITYILEVFNFKDLLSSLDFFKSFLTKP